MTQWPMKIVCAAAAGLIALAACAQSASAANASEVDDSIKKAKGYIYSQMKGDNWEQNGPPKFGKMDGEGQADPVKGRQWGGATAMAVYGLLAAGENPQDPRMKGAIEWLKTAPISGHYAVAMRAQVWTFLKNEREAKVSSTLDFKILLNGLCADKRLGYYAYYTDLATGKVQPDWFDRSVSNFSVLGMWACEQAGQEVPTKYWEIVDARWKKDQQADGGWKYQDGREVSGTMTAAGVATLFITQDYLLQKNNWSTCNGGFRNEWIERGLAYMDKNAAGMLEGKGGENAFYGMYGIERIGVASGRKYFGTLDWYEVGAESLVRSQSADGSWGKEGGTHNPKGIPNTVFATLFLVRGRAPVIINKLEYANDAPGGKAKGQQEPWNERPRDVANFAHWSGRQTETYLNWHIVNLKVPAIELNDCPILYIAGSEALNFSQADVDKLRTFVENGGMILGNADCAALPFRKSFQELGRKLFPRYEFRELEANHVIYTEEQFKLSKMRSKPRLEGLSNGVRELMILIPDADFGRAWQTRSEKTKEEQYQTAQNIVMYSVSKVLKNRGDGAMVAADPKVQADKTINVVLLQVGDNPAPEPGGWRRLSHILHNQMKTDLKVESAPLGQGKLAGAKIAHLTGTTKFKFTPDQQKEIKDFVAGGGTLIVDAAGGATDFADSAEAALAATFGGAPAAVGSVLEPTHEVYTLPGAKIENFEYRDYVKGRMSGKLNEPRVRGIAQGNRIGVFYSREDLSAGLVGNAVDGILGYAPDTASAIMRNLVLYSAGVKGVVAVKAEADRPRSPAPAPKAKPPAGKNTKGKPAKTK